MKAKVVLVGDRRTSKTELIRPCVLSTFDARYIVTLGCRVSQKEVEIVTPDGFLRLDMNIWDIMGSGGVREYLGGIYFHQTRGILAVCDATMPETLRSLKDWVEGVYSVAGKVPTFILVRAERQEGNAFGREEVAELADMFEAAFALVPAGPEATPAVVEAAFRWLAKHIVASQLEGRQ